jgi:para-nitrobenzyl esterase
VLKFAGENVEAQKMRVQKLKKSAFTFFILLLAFPATSNAQIQVKTQGGVLEGKLEGGIVSFRGIPFAAPPVGELRWRAPQPPVAWNGVRKADHFRASCMQFKAGERLPWTREFMVQNEISEDCLYLNIWTPKVGAWAHLPVIVFIHGGGFTEGAGAVAIYDGANLAAKGAVVVTINYRLGVFGFLAYPELTAESIHHSSGNYGLLDQIAALQWVKSNIAAYGGDPRNVTIWGQSAGAFSVGALIASPVATGLFHHAMADSGLGFASLPMLNLSEAELNGIKFTAEHHAASLKELRALPAESMLPDPNDHTVGALRFSLIVDGWILPDTPNDMNARGNDNDVAVLTGYQAEDPALFLPPIKSLADYHRMVQKRYGSMAAEFEKLYPATKENDITKVMLISSQDRDRVSMFMWARERVRSHHQPVFTYFFDRGIPWPAHPEFGAFHTGEIPYFFLNLKLLDRPWKREDYTLAGQVSSYLINFASKGNPNGSGLPEWPSIEATRPQTMELGTRLGVMSLSDQEKLDFWIRYYHSPAGRNSPPF